MLKDNQKELDGNSDLDIRQLHELAVKRLEVLSAVKDKAALDSHVAVAGSDGKAAGSAEGEEAKACKLEPGIVFSMLASLCTMQQLLSTVEKLGQAATTKDLGAVTSSNVLELGKKQKTFDFCRCALGTLLSLQSTQCNMYV